jgi:seryl-tRNA synthetase
MLDIKFVANNAEAVAANCAHRHMPRDVGVIVGTYRARNEAITEMENVRRAMNDNAKAMKGPMPAEQRSELIARGRQLKQDVAVLDTRADELRSELDTMLRALPNMTHPESPSGALDEDHVELSRWGAPRDFAAEGFEAQDHVQLGADLDLIDFESGAAVAGQKFYFLRNEAVLLDLALQRFAIERLMKHGFTPVITPDLARPSILEGIGFNPRGVESQVYSINDHDLCLVGTSEITIGGMLAEQLLTADRLPLKIAGISHCFRTEAGAAGRESRGLYRVHQFTKVEMFIFCHPGADENDQMISASHHDELLAIEEELLQALEIPYRVVDVCAGDLGAPAYRKFDIEAWMPGRGAYGEVTSASNCTDYQARRLNIRARPLDGGKKAQFVHTLNGTAIAISRTMLALLENHQQADGSIRIPVALQPYCGLREIRR